MSDISYVEYKSDVLVDGYHVQSNGQDEANILFIQARDYGVRVVLKEGANSVIPWSNVKFALESGRE